MMLLQEPDSCIPGCLPITLIYLQMNLPSGGKSLGYGQGTKQGDKEMCCLSLVFPARGLCESAMMCISNELISGLVSGVLAPDGSQSLLHAEVQCWPVKRWHV